MKLGEHRQWEAAEGDEFSERDWRRLLTHLGDNPDRLPAGIRIYRNSKLDDTSEFGQSGPSSVLRIGLLGSGSSQLGFARELVELARSGLSW
jgi:hypothetical protein